MAQETEIGGHTLRQTPTPGAGVARADSQAHGQSAGFFPVLLTDDQAAACLGVSVRKFHELRAEPWMVKPVMLGPRLLRWPRAELEQAIAAMPRQAQPQGEPARLRRGKIDAMKRRGVPV